MGPVQPAPARRAENFIWKCTRSSGSLIRFSSGFTGSRATPRWTLSSAPWSWPFWPWSLGKLTLRLVLLVAQPPLDKATAEARKYQNLSMDALAAGDRPTYEAANQLANDAFGKTFFMQIAQSGAFLWPVCVALAWMGYRFADLAFPLPLVQISLGYVGVFHPVVYSGLFPVQAGETPVALFSSSPGGSKAKSAGSSHPSPGLWACNAGERPTIALNYLYLYNIMLK